MTKKESIFLRLLLSIIVPAAVISVPGILRANGPTDLVTLPIVAAVISVIIVNAFVYKRIISLAKFLDTSRNEEGDLTQRMPNERTKELYAIARGHNVFVAQIHRIVFKLKNIVRKGFSISQELAQKTSEVAKSLDEIAESSRTVTANERKLNDSIRDSRAHVSEIRDAIRKIVAQIESQAASVDQSSAAVEESIASIRSMNSISRSKAEFVETLNKLARESGGNMRGTMEAMRGIASSVDLITGLIGVIDEVAEKTNLLALNAAIEAAHAGDHGKGFAVVADEIGKLAEATSESAGEVNKNLSSMIAEIESARALTEQTDSSIEQLLGGITEVSDSFSEIIRGLDEMSSGTTEITGSLTQLVDITEEVKENSRIIDRKAETIDGIMNGVIEVSGRSLASMDGFTEVLGSLMRKTEDIAASGKSNAQTIAIIDGEVSRFKIIDTSDLRSSDGQPLVQWNREPKDIPARPDNPRSFPENDARHWHDLEYAGWNSRKINIPESPGDGPRGKNVILLESCDHPYHVSYKIGCAKIAEAFGVTIRSYNANYSPEIQARQVELAIKDKPDLIILTPTSVKESTQWFKRINERGIPVIGSNTTPSDEGFQYIVGWTGPDDWGQFRMLAREFARRMGNSGGYAIMRHVKGNSNYFSRTHSIVTELKSMAPGMRCLAMESALKEEDAKRLAGQWLREFGDELKGFCFSDPSIGARGIVAAIKESGRSDLAIVSSGNSLVTQDLVKDGSVHAITYQSAEADGALAMEMAIDWFSGIEIEPIRYLPMKLITQANVGEFYPAQW